MPGWIGLVKTFILTFLIKIFRGFQQQYPQQNFPKKTDPLKIFL